MSPPSKKQACPLTPTAGRRTAPRTTVQKRIVLKFLNVKIYKQHDRVRDLGSSFYHTAIPLRILLIGSLTQTIALVFSRWPFTCCSCTLAVDSEGHAHSAAGSLAGYQISSL